MMIWVVGIVSVVIALARYVIVATLGAQRLIRPHRRVPGITPAAVGVHYEDVRLQARGEALQIAAWYLPAPSATRAVIIAHGVGGCRSREFTGRSLALAAQLVHNGFSVLMLDLRGHGTSDAAPMSYGLAERRDVLGAVDWLRARGYAPGTIGVLGASMGGVAGIGAAGEDSAIGALVVDSACADFPAMMRQHFRQQSKLPVCFLPGTLLIACLLTGERIDRLRPAQMLQAIERRPLLIIHARGDQLVPVAHAEALARAGSGQLWLTDGKRHLGSWSAGPVAYSERVTQFFEEALRGPVVQLVPMATLPTVHTPACSV